MTLLKKNGSECSISIEASLLSLEPQHHVALAIEHIFPGSVRSELIYVLNIAELI